MELYDQSESKTTLKFWKKIAVVMGEIVIWAPEEGINDYLEIWLESQKYDVIKMRMYISSYT